MIGRLAFDIIRNNDLIGTHVLTFRRRGDGFDVASAVDIAVRVGPIVLFRYELSGLEQWEKGVMTPARAWTDDDGTPASMRCDRRDDGLGVSGSETVSYSAPPDAVLATHWNRAELDGPWINPRDGRLFRPIVARRGVESIARSDGSTDSAEHFVLSGDVGLELRYDSMQCRTALRFTARDRSEIRYRRN